jgi:hypothetical protein
MMGLILCRCGDRSEQEFAGMRKLSLALCAAAFAFMTACQGGTPAQPSATSPSGPAKTEVPQTLEYTAREAFQKCYQAAHMWAADARPYSLRSELFKGYPGHGGKAVIWRAGFASASRRFIKAFVWSGTKSEDAPAFGVSSGAEDSYSPTNSSTIVFDPNFLKVDSDKAYEVAQQHGGEKLTKANADQPVFYMLAWDPRENMLVWHVVYGTNSEEAKLRIAVNASTGAYVRTEH